MTTAEAIRTCARRNILFTLDAEGFRMFAPRGAMSDDLRASLSEDTEEVLRLLRAAPRCLWCGGIVLSDRYGCRCDDCARAAWRRVYGCEMPIVAPLPPPRKSAATFAGDTAAEAHPIVPDCHACAAITRWSDGNPSKCALHKSASAPRRREIRL